MSMYQRLTDLGYDESLYAIERYDEYVASRIAKGYPVKRFADWLDSPECVFGEEFLAWLDED